MLGTSGNLSIRITEPETEGSELRFLITVSGKDKGELTEDDFILVDENGCHCEEPRSGDEAISNDRPSAETLLHAAIYNHTKANAVFHVHTTNSTLLSQVLVFEGLEMLKGFGFKTHDVKVTIPLLENSQDMEYLASILPSYINEDVPGLLLRGHGIYAWGKTTQEAKRHIEIFEFLFEYRIKELMMPSVPSRK